MAQQDVREKAPANLSACQYRQFTGPDCILQALKALEEDGRRINDWFQDEFRPVPYNMVEGKHRMEAEGRLNIDKCKCCQMVFSEKNLPKVDHDHFTGQIRGIVCIGCNKKLFIECRKLPILIHNFRNYDCHAMCIEGLCGPGLSTRDS